MTKTQEFSQEYIDTKLLKYYGQYRRGLKGAYEALEVLQEVRKDIYGEKLKLDMNLRPEGAYRMNH